VINNLAVTLPRAFDKGDLDTVMRVFKPFFADIPHRIQIPNEKYYQTVIHSIFKMPGFHSHSEVQTADGRIDTLVETKDCVYCFEFKFNGTAQKALDQINSKDYLLAWTNTGKKLYKIGINFNIKKHNIDEWKAVLPE
jgi:hypothetical protein